MLVDDDGVRAAMTASWLKQMALHEVAVLDGGLAGASLETGPGPERALGLEALRYREIAPGGLRAALAAGRSQLVDLTRSVAYRTGHIGGARHGVRTRLTELIPRLPAHDLLVLTSGDSMLARYAVAETEGLADAEVMVLAGGNEAWRDAGLPWLLARMASRPTPSTPTFAPTTAPPTSRRRCRPISTGRST